MTTDDKKSRTIKIDIRSSLENGHIPFSEKHVGVAGSSSFDSLDYRFLFEQSYDAILLTDPAGCILAENIRARQFFGYDDSELVGGSIRTLIAGVTDSLLSEIQSVIGDGRYLRIQAFAMHKDGRFTAVEIIVMGNRGKAPDQVCYLVRDVQGRWEAERTLLSAYHAMDNTDSGIGMIDLDGKIIYANHSMVARLANREESDVVGQKLSVWFDAKTVIAPMMEKIKRRLPWSGEQRIISATGTTWLAISAVPDINEDQELCGVVLSVRDTADRRRAEIAEYQVERNRIMMESLAGVCHALGQPATVLLTSIEIMKLGDPKDTQMQKEMVDLCYDAVIQLRDLLQKMNAKRMYASEPYLHSEDASAAIVNLEDEAEHESGKSSEGG
jgi:PAS domain S-box-containing protein